MQALICTAAGDVHALLCHRSWRQPQVHDVAAGTSIAAMPQPRQMLLQSAPQAALSSCRMLHCRQSCLRDNGGGLADPGTT